MFETKGVIQVPAEGIEEDEIMMAALEAGAEDISNEGEFYEVTSDPKDLHAVTDALSDESYTIEVSQIQKIPNNFTEIGGDDVGKVVTVLELLDDHDDVQKVSASVDFTDEMLAGLE